MIVDIDNFEMFATEVDDEVNERDGAVNVVTSLVLQAVLHHVRQGDGDDRASEGALVRARKHFSCQYQKLRDHIRSAVTTFTVF